AQMLRAGAKIEALLETTPRRNWLRALPYLPDFLLSPYRSKGLSLLREVKAKVPVIRASAIEARGKGKVEHVAYVGGDGERRVDADLLLLHQGVVPNTNLAIAAGLAHRWNDRQLCFEPVLDADFASSVP